MPVHCQVFAQGTRFSYLFGESLGVEQGLSFCFVSADWLAISGAEREEERRDGPRKEILTLKPGPLGKVGKDKLPKAGCFVFSASFISDKRRSGVGYSSATLQAAN